MPIRPPLFSLLALTLVSGLALLPADTARGVAGDELLFSASGGAPPNILLLLDTSGSMGKTPSNIADCSSDCRKRDLAGKAIRDLVTTVNPSDGAGGYINNVRFGFSIFTSKGARVLVPIGDDTVGDIVSFVASPDIATAADALNADGGNSHGLAMADSARYLAHDPVTSPTHSFGPHPPFGFAGLLVGAAAPNPTYTGDAYPASWPDVLTPADPDKFRYEDPTLPSVWDLACRPTFLVHIDDGLWGGDDGDRFGDCTDIDGDGSSETCHLEFIGDGSGDGNFWMEDIAARMFDFDFSPAHPGKQNVVTHVITFDDPASAPLMEIVAQQGGGTFHYATSGTELTKSLLNITVNIFESLGAFAGVAVPSSRTGSGAALYNAWFEPSSNDFWAGHLESYGLDTDGTILDKAGADAVDSSTGLLVEPHNPFWDAGLVLASNASRTLYTTDANGDQVVFNTTNVSETDLNLAASSPPPPPPPGPCAPVAASIPAGWDFQIIEIDGVAVSGPPYNAPPDEKVKLKYCVDPSRTGIKDRFGTYAIDDLGTDAIDLKDRKDDKAICTYDGSGNVNGGWEEKDLNVGKVEQLIQIRYYLGESLTAATLAGNTDSICVTSSGSPPVPPNPDFAPYPNASTSGIDTYPELQTAVIDYVYGKDAFDQDNDTSFTDLRSTVLGDIFHSTPLVIGQPTQTRFGEPGFQAFYDAYAERDRVVYVGANDGVFHAFHAGVFHADNPGTTSIDEGDDPATAANENGYYDHGTGSELFGYVPRILLDKLKLLSHNNPRTAYFVDASPVAADAWVGDGTGSDITKTADEWATVVIEGMREGGPGYIALDVTDPAAGALDPHGPYPQLLWEFTHASLGESWSEPVITRVKLEGPSSLGDNCFPDNGDGDCREQWVAIFGGGYERTADPNHFAYEPDTSSPDWTDAGRAIFMVALDSGDVVAMVKFDDSGPADGTGDMKYAIPSKPAVLDIDFDGFADVVYVGDIGGQMWKWDISDVGVDSDADGDIDTWEAGVFFRNSPVTLAGGTVHYRPIFSPPSATFVNGHLTLAFGTGEREDLRFGGDEDATTDENNRFYVVADFEPTGANAFNAVTTEADMSGSDITNLPTDPDPSDAGFFYTLPDAEKFVTDSTIFAGLVIVASYTPSAGAAVCTTGGGQAFLHVFDLNSGEGFFADDSTAADPENDRKTAIGGGLPSNPRVSLGRDPSDDRVYVKTSAGQIIVIGEDPDGDGDPEDDGFGRESGNRNIIYWRQIY